MVNKLRLILLLLLSTAIITPKSYAQEVDSAKVLQLINVKKGKSELIFQGEKVIYKLKNDSKKNYKGYIELINEEGLVVSGKGIKLSDIEMIMSKSHRKLIRFTGGSTILMGGLLTTSGISLLILKQGISPYVGIVGLVTGIPAIIAGILPFTHTNHYSTKKGWSAHIISIPVYNEEEDLN